MRIALSICFSIFLLVFSTNWHVDIHLCHDNVKSVTIGHGDADCGNNSACGKCCDNVHIDYLAEHDYTQLQSWELPNIDKVLYVVNYEEFKSFVSSKNTFTFFSDLSPPPKRKLFLQYHRLQFYG